MINVSDSQDDNLSMDTLSIDLTPLLDVMFILLIFFILTANSVEFAFEMDLPVDEAAQSEAIDDDKRISLALFSDENKWQVQGETFNDWEKVKSEMRKLHQSKPDASIILAGDKDVSLEKLLQALTFFKQENMKAAQILMEKE